MASLTGGAFITTLEGKRCTAVPKQGTKTADPNQNAESKTDTTTATSESPARFTVTSETSTEAKEGSSTSTTTSSSTSPALITSTTSEPTSSSPQQTETSAIIPPAAVLSPPEPSPSPPPAATITSSIPTLTEIDPTSQPAPAPQTQGAVTEASETDIVKTAPTTQPQAQQGSQVQSTQRGTALPDVTASQALPDSATAVPTLFTTIGKATASSDAAAQASGSPSPNDAISAVPASANGAIQSTVAIAGGVIGGVLAITMVAFFFWFWRRRLFKKRRSTLLTPLTGGGGGGGSRGFGPDDEKGSYVINRGSIGPTRRAVRFKAALGYNIGRIHGSVSRIVRRGSAGASVDMNRGNSQFMEPSAAAASTRGRADSTSSGTGYPTGNEATATTAKDRLVGWWASLTADIGSAWRLRNGGGNRGLDEKQAGNPNPSAAAAGQGPPARQPDFLTLLSMDNRELDREAQRRRVARATGSASSSDRFLGSSGGGGLNLDFSVLSSDNPFADSNALAHISAKPAPLQVGPNPNANPFSDANATIPRAMNPNTYVAEMRRSRGQSVSVAAPGNRAPSTLYRDSVESFGTRRNKFRSDPFDLEPLRDAPGGGGSVSSSTGGTAGSSMSSSGVGAGAGAGVRRPAGAHVRSDSFTSKYSSGGGGSISISLGDWSDPGPDVGPAAERTLGRSSPTVGWRARMAGAGGKRSSGGGSQGSVGMAM